MTTDLVNVAVPRPYLMQVYRYLADLEGKESAPVDAEEAENVIVAGILKEWTPELIQRSVQESQSTMRGILRALAESPDVPLSSHQLGKALGGVHDWNSVAGALGALGHRCYGRYKVQTLPFQTYHDREVGGKVHCMPKQIAEQVLRWLDDSDED
jgi:hypothetical protein